MGPKIKRKKDSFLTFLLVSCFIFFVFGCSKSIKKGSLPSKSILPAEKKTILSEIHSVSIGRMKFIDNLRALADIKIQFPIKKIKRKNIILFRNDPSIRFEVLSLIGKPVLYFVSNSRHTSIYYPDANILYKGAYSPENIGRIIGMDIELNKIITILSGNYYIPSRTEKTILKENRENYVIKFFSKNNLVAKVFIDKKSYLPLKLIDYNLYNNNLITVEYLDYKKSGSYLLPHKIKIENKKKNLKILIKYLSVALNENMPDSSFKLHIDSSAKILPLKGY